MIRDGTFLRVASLGFTSSFIFLRDIGSLFINTVESERKNPFGNSWLQYVILRKI